MLRSRDNSKNAHQRNGIQIDEPATGSSFTKYGVLVCVLFTIVVAYFVFIDNNSNTTTTPNLNTLKNPSKTDISSSIPHSLSSPNPPMQPNAPKTPITGSIQHASTPQNKIPPQLAVARKTFSAKTAKALTSLHPKVLGDLNPLQNDKLQRLMSRQNLRKNNKFNLLRRPGIGPLKSLAAPLPAFPNAVDSSMTGTTKEISFTLDVKSLPRSTGKQPSIFIRQTYPTKGNFNHDFVLIFLHGHAFSSATWSELGILQSLAMQGYVSYALDMPNYGQSVKIQATNHKWLSEITGQLTGSDKSIGQRITSVGGISTANKKYILITASMSGKYAIPLLLDTPKTMVGMITIAPVATDKFKKEQYEKVKIPVCIIYGEADTGLGEASKKNLVQIPNHKLIMVPGGQHAAYKSDPKFFHQQVVKWLSEFFD